MASVQRKSDAYHCQFCYLGKRHTVTVGKVSQDETEAFRGSVELLLMRLNQKLLTVPPGVHITDFVIPRGKVLESIVAAPEKVIFSDFTQRYLDATAMGRWSRTA